MERFGDYLHSGPNAYPDTFLPPHTDQFYPTDIPMYYDEDHRFNIDRALSKEDVLKQHPSYPYLDTSKVTFADTPESRGAHYSGDDQTVMNLKYTDPQNITARNLESVGHETVHRTADPFHGIPEVYSGLLEGSIEPFVGSYYPEGPKHSYVWPDEMKDALAPSENIWRKTEHLLNYAIQNEAYPESTQGELWKDFFPSNYNRAFTQEIADKSKYYSLPGIGTRKYYPPRDAFLGNAPGEVRRGIMGLKDSFRHAALKYKNILENYNKRRRARAGPQAAHRRPPRVKPVPPRGGGADVFNMPIPPSKKTYVSPARPHGDGGGRPRPDKPGGFTDPGKGSYGPHKADGGLINFFKNGGFLG